MKQERHRVCAVCGKRHGPTYGFQSVLERLGIKGVWAAPPCVARVRGSDVGCIKQTLAPISYPSVALKGRGRYG
jgi:hypothetical protein